MNCRRRSITYAVSWDYDFGRGTGSFRIGAGFRARRGTGFNGNFRARQEVLSAAARKRIAAAQRKRWAEHRKSLKTTSKKSE